MALQDSVRYSLETDPHMDSESVSLGQVHLEDEKEVRTPPSLVASPSCLQRFFYRVESP